jgi:hypothetical protein
MNNKFNHRLVQIQDNGQTLLAVHEVNYWPDGAPMDHTEMLGLAGESVEEINQQVASIAAAMALPVLHELDFRPMTAIEAAQLIEPFPLRRQVLDLPVRECTV